MRRNIFLFLLVSLLLIGCSQGGDLKTYDHSELKEELQAEGMNPKLPTQFPVMISEYERRIPPHPTTIQETIFIGEEDGVFTLTISPGTVEYHNLEKEELTINGNDGFYIESELPGPSVHWTDGDYHYILQSENLNLEKEMMLEIAESFQ